MSYIQEFVQYKIRTTNSQINECVGLYTMQCAPHTVQTVQTVHNMHLETENYVVMFFLIHTVTPIHVLI